MYEIELKAHVADRSKVQEALMTFAKPLEVIDKDDTYYRLPPSSANGARGGARQSEKEAAQTQAGYITCRIRRETRRTLDGKVEKDVLFTYKNKRLMKDGEGAAIEVNDEKECRMDNSEAVEAMLLYAGFTVSHKKQKKSEGFAADTECGKAHIELCTVPPLGDFLEIEIMSEKNDEQTAKHIHKAIKELFARCGIPPEAIEERYYTDMLDSIKRQDKN